MKIQIVEDEAMVAERLARLVGKVFPVAPGDITILATLEEAKTRLEARPLDLVFLDLNLDSEDGFDLLRQTLVGPYQTIIASANIDRAIEAFEFGVLDFVPKPFTTERLQMAWERYSGVRKNTSTELKVLPVKAGNRIKLLKLKDIIYFEAQGKYTDIHLMDNVTYAQEKSLTSLERLLPSNFMRIHRSYMANLDHAESLASHRGSKYSLTLKDGQVLPVGRSHIKTLKAIFS